MLNTATAGLAGGLTNFRNTGFVFTDFFIDFFARWLTTLIGLAGVFSKLAAKPFGTTGGDFETGGRRGSTIGLAMATIGDGTIGRGGASSVA